MNNRGSIPSSPVSGFGCGRAYRTSVAAANKSAARAMGREWQGPFSERSARRAGTFFRKVRENGRDLFPKGPRECVANAGSFRLFILTSFARRFGKASLPKTTLRNAPAAGSGTAGREAHSAWPQAKASLPERMLRSMSSPLTPALSAQTSPRCHHFVDDAPSKNPPKFRKITSNISNFTFPSIHSTAFTLKAKIPPFDSQ